MRVYVRNPLTRRLHRVRYSPSATARYRAWQRTLGHLLGGIAVLLGILWAAWRLAGGL